MCFHCTNGNPHLHIPSEVRNVKTKILDNGLHFTCTSCGKGLLLTQATGLSPHWCSGRYVMINPGYVPRLEEVATGYHKRPIKRGVFGELSKIREELEELEDANEQGVHIMALCELSDLYGALRAYANKRGLMIKDLEQMADVSKRVFESGHRKSRD